MYSVLCPGQNYGKTAVSPRHENTWKQRQARLVPSSSKALTPAPVLYPGIGMDWISVWMPSSSCPCGPRVLSPLSRKNICWILLKERPRNGNANLLKWAGPQQKRWAGVDYWIPGILPPSVFDRENSDEYSKSDCVVAWVSHLSSLILLIYLLQPIRRFGDSVIRRFEDSNPKVLRKISRKWKKIERCNFY